MKFTHKCSGNDVVIYYNRKGEVSRWFGPAVQGQPEWVLNGKPHPIYIFKKLLNKFKPR